MRPTAIAIGISPIGPGTVLSSAPVRTHTAVTSLKQTDTGYDVTTTAGSLRCRTAVVASGACNVPHVPALRQAVPTAVESLTPFDYRNPNQLPSGGVLVPGHGQHIAMRAEVERIAVFRRLAPTAAVIALNSGRLCRRLFRRFNDGRSGEWGA